MHLYCFMYWIIPKPVLILPINLLPPKSLMYLSICIFITDAGVGAGDFNNDGLIDFFFASNQGQNKIYLNQGKLKFKDVTEEATIPNDGGWSTGVSVVDINNDGLLDIYICRVGNYEILNSKNQLLVCKGIDKNGVPYYKDEAQNMVLIFQALAHRQFFLIMMAMVILICICSIILFIKTEPLRLAINF